MARSQLTQRERDVLDLAISGLTNEEIATRLAISRRTVEAHMRTLLRKTGVSRRTQLAALYQRGDAVAGESIASQLPDTDNNLTARLGQQRLDLANYERALRSHADAVRGLVDRQFPLFEERVEITVVVGEQDGQDIIVERRWTRPRPYLVYRILAPILTWPEGPPFDPDALALACTVDGQDIHVDFHLVRDVDGRPLVMILFQPGLRAETAWVLHYRSPQLWNPLRSSGRDNLTWASATLDHRHPPTITELTLKVVFPASWSDERVTEQSNLGVVHTERLPTGQTQVSWYHDAPGAAAYYWVLHASPGR